MARSRATSRSSWFGGNPLNFMIAAISLALQIATVGYIYANVLGKIEANATAIQTLKEYTQASLARNERDDTLREDATTKGLTRVETQLSGLNQMRVDVEVMKQIQLTHGQTLNRIEKAFDRLPHLRDKMGSVGNGKGG